MALPIRRVPPCHTIIPFKRFPVSNEMREPARVGERRCLGGIVRVGRKGEEHVAVIDNRWIERIAESEIERHRRMNSPRVLNVHLVSTRLGSGLMTSRSVSEYVHGATACTSRIAPEKVLKRREARLRPERRMTPASFSGKRLEVTCSGRSSPPVFSVWVPCCKVSAELNV